MNDDIVSRLRQTRANMIGTDDETHYWDCHDAANEIERLRDGTATTGCIRPITTRPHPSRDVLDVLRRLLEHRTSDVGSYEFVLEAWIEEAADEIERLRKKQVQ